jgi:predicted dehydrogenase
VKDIDLRGKVVTTPGNYQAFYENLFEVIRHGKPLAVKPEEARNTIRILEACLESHKTKKTIQLTD